MSCVIITLMFNMFSFSHSPRNQLANHGRKDERKFSHKLQTKQDQSAAITAAEDFSSGSQSQPLTEEPARQPWPESWKEVLLQATDQARPASYGHCCRGLQLGVSVSGYPSFPLSLHIRCSPPPSGLGVWSLHPYRF